MSAAAVALWAGRGVLAAAFSASGGLKLARSRDQLLAMPPMGWAADFSAPQVKLIGAAELSGAAGLVLPGVLGWAPALSSVAAAALALLMGGAVATHLRRREPPTPALVLGLACAALCGGLLLGQG